MKNWSKNLSLRWKFMLVPIIGIFLIMSLAVYFSKLEQE